MKYKHRSGKKRSRRGMHRLVDEMLCFQRPMLLRVVHQMALLEGNDDAMRRFCVGYLLAKDPKSKF